MKSTNSIRRAVDKIENRIGTVTIALILTALLLLISDSLFGYVLNIFYQTADNLYPKDIYFEPHPYTMYGGTRDRELQQSDQLNELGYRGAVPKMPKPIGEFRIAIIGGSTVLNGTPSIAELVEFYLQQEGHPKVRVYNFGVAASVLRMDIARLVYEIGDYSPDLVIFYGGGNDIGMPYQSDPRPGYPPNFLAYELNPLLLAGTKEQTWGVIFKIALLQSKVFRSLAGAPLRQSLVSLEQVRKQEGWNTPAWSHAVAENYIADVKRAARITQAFRAKSLFVFQPLLEFKSHLSPGETALRDLNFTAHAQSCRSSILGNLSQLQRENIIQYADISTVFDSTEEDIFLDGIHIRQEYQPLVAKAVAKEIKARILGKSE